MDSAQQGRPYITGEVNFDGKRMVSSWMATDSSYTEWVKREAAKCSYTMLYEQKLVDSIKSVQTSLIEKYMDDIADGLASKNKTAR